MPPKNPGRGAITKRSSRSRSRGRGGSSSRTREESRGPWDETDLARGESSSSRGESANTRGEGSRPRGRSHERGGNSTSRRSRSSEQARLHGEHTVRILDEYQDSLSAGERAASSRQLDERTDRADFLTWQGQLLTHNQAAERDDVMLRDGTPIDRHALRRLPRPDGQGGYQYHPQGVDQYSRYPDAYQYQQHYAYPQQTSSQQEFIPVYRPQSSFQQYQGQQDVRQWSDDAYGSQYSQTAQYRPSRPTESQGQRNGPSYNAWEDSLRRPHDQPLSAAYHQGESSRAAGEYGAYLYQHAQFHREQAVTERRLPTPSHHPPQSPDMPRRADLPGSRPVHSQTQTLNAPGQVQNERWGRPQASRPSRQDSEERDDGSDSYRAMR